MIPTWLVLSKRRAVRAFWTARVVHSAGYAVGPIVVNGRSRVTAQTRLGGNVHFNGMSILGCGEVEIGDNFHSGRDCVIISEIHNHSGTKLPYDESYVAKPVFIGDNVWLGVRVMVLGGVRIGEGAIIQAGSVVVTDIPALAIAGGHPARVFASRDAVHYERLKAAQRFH